MCGDKEFTFIEGNFSVIILHDNHRVFYDKVMQQKQEK